MFPFKLISSLISAGKIVAKFKPNVVIGTGGFASGPVLKMAARKGIPCVLQEQNSYAGITNKLLAKSAAKICVAYDDMERFFPTDKIVKTGNPVRADLINPLQHINEAYEFFGLNPKKTTLLVLGGSLGARRINQLVEKELKFFSGLGIQLVWQCGRGYYNEYKKYHSEDVKVYDFLNKMNFAYSAADIIISRAGASSVSELCIVGKPVIFIPSPNVAEDHQSKNARSLVEKQAALMVEEKELADEFEDVFSDLNKSDKRKKLLSENIKALALPDATRNIVDEIEHLLQI